MTAQTTGNSVASLSPADKAQFTRLFVGAGPENGLLSAAKAQGIFVKSSLPTETLAKAWNLADTQQRGALDLPDFIIGMYYLQHLMTGSIKDLPITLPPGLYEQASGGRPKPTVPTNPMVAQLTGSGPARLTQQLTGQGIMQPQRTGQSAIAQSPTRQYTAPPAAAPSMQAPFAAPIQPAQSAQPSWDVTSESKVASDRFFDGLDTGRKGFIEGDIAVPFLMQSGLPETDLAQVWWVSGSSIALTLANWPRLWGFRDLADIRKEGKLGKDEFAVAMFLINNKLAGKELPGTLPQSMIPPSLRSQVPNANQSEPDFTLRYFRDCTETVSADDATKDLFDVFGDSPPAMQPSMPPQQSYFASPPSRAASVNVPPPPPAASRAKSPAAPPSRMMSPPAVPSRGSTVDAFGSTPFGSQPDLMGDDSVSTPKPTVDHSAEIGNAQNSLTSTEKAVNDLERERKGLEAESSTSAAQLRDLELRLSSVRAQHETETRLVTDLRTRVSEQKEQITKLRQDLIQNESELSALRAEKDETEQALLRDREEVRAASKQMKAVADETSTLKTLLEKLRKEARQQKGMVAISKKQVATAEGGRDAVQKEIDQVAADNSAPQEEEMLAASPQAASPIMSPFIRPASTASLHQAAAIPLPATPQQVLSPNFTGSNQRSNNPFERMGFSAKPAERSLSPLQSTEAVSRGDQGEGISTLQAATMGIGGAVAVGALAAGSVIGAAAVGTGAAVATVAEHMTHDGQDLRSPVHSASNEIEEANEDDVKTPAATQDRADPFGLEEQDSPSRQVTPSANVVSDPFGMPTTTQSEQGGFSAGFDDGFGDDFSKANAANEIGAAHSEAEEVSPAGGIPLPDNLAPASQTAEDFQEALNDRGNAPSAIPASMRPDLDAQGRSFSTEVFAPNSMVHTPETELPPSTPMSVESAAVPVDVQALQPRSASAHGESDDSSDEDEGGPEDLDRARSPYDPREMQGTSAAGSSVLASRQNEDIPQRDEEIRQMDQFAAPRSQSPIGIAPATQSPPSEQLQALGLGAPVAVGGTSQQPPTMNREDSFDPFAPSATPVSATATGTPKRREPPPPPTSQKSMSSNSNPFGLPTAETAQPAFGDHFAAPVGIPAAAQQSNSSFDDDFDFDDLQPAQIADGGSAAPLAAPQATHKATNDFDDEFDDFSPDFEMVNKPPTAGASPFTNTPVPVAQGAPQLPQVGSSGGFGTINPSTSSGFSFEDAFMDRSEQT
jgi:epidermal growth factor receptor substrate 15